VTRGEYLEFVRAVPRWRRGRAPAALVGRAYLASWPGATDAGAEPRRPATEVSWFAARAYCAWRQKRLPTTDEWEYVARADETRVDASRQKRFVARLLELYTSRANAAASVGSTFVNRYGVADMHGLVWEWTEDFNSLLVSDDSRATAGRDHQLFCAAGVIGATDTSNYPAFMRYGVRAALEGRSTTPGTGFRCAR
jgi:formylglycine-generating enzyme required for sulfatase activity